MRKGDHELYGIWRNMKKRCSCPTNKDYKYYGAKGIKVSSAWRDFWVFVKDMGDRPINYTLDRIDGKKGYSKSNCKWSSHSEQSRNRSVCKYGGPPGVTFNKAAKKWQAALPKPYSKIIKKHVGLFLSSKEAADAYALAIKRAKKLMAAK